MHTEKPSASRINRLPIFPIACWILGLMAFAQLWIAGMALATRLENSRQVQVVEKEIVKLVAVRVPVPVEGGPSISRESGVISRPPAPMPVQSSSHIDPTPLASPQIEDPGAERMVNEARAARVAGDMGKAVMKLEEAISRSSSNPVVHYELGLVHEQMGVFDKAAAYYEKVFQMGVSGAGTLYGLAAAKLRDGFEQPDAMLGKLSLGRVRIFNNLNDGNGQRVVLTIPVQKSPAEEINVSEIAVSVVFFNRTNQGEIIQLEDKSWVTEQWVTLPFDWIGGEESLRMNYQIPVQDNQTEHLFGKRSYYGHVVSLIYKGEVMDVQAWPRDLAARIPHGSSMPSGDGMVPEFQDKLPADFDPEIPLLPALPEK